MNLQRMFFATLFALGAVVCHGQIDSKALPLPAGVKVLFTPKDNIEAEIVRLINNASAEIIFNQHAISNPRIAAAIVDSYRNRKVYVAGIIERDPGIANYRTPEFFVVNNIPVALSAKDTPNLNRYLIIDRQIVATGSYQWTLSSQNKNKENLLVISDPGIAVAYREHFEHELSISEMPEIKSLGETKNESR